MARCAGGRQLGVVEGAIEGPEAQPEGQAAPSRAELGAPVDVEEPDRLEQVAARLWPGWPRTAAAGTVSATTKARSMSLAGKRLTSRAWSGAGGAGPAGRQPTG